ncbi:hypothetical protein [Lysinibacillus sp. BW-2-10]|uniref:hypothetical protein n=1 Tax=Lysinibacillus sp. BW-2-10 TaxID=2590030 RepID=UPI00117F0901|nr:hypothetical protein [Lysinibacillus sp. BW-2-10]TSI10693.1 hypothetical protein FJQ64_03300 [Lysinibacillus sp. BW-2-10]
MQQLFLLLLEVVYLFLAFKSGSAIFFMIAIILGGWWLYEVNKEAKKRNEELEIETIEEIEEYPHTRYILSPDYLQALMIDENSDTFRILTREDLDSEFEPREYGFHELYEVAIVEDGKNVALTSKGGVHGWSLIDGGAKVDVHVSGAEAAEAKSKEVKKLMLKLVVDDLSNPIVEYIFLDNEEAIPKNLDEYKDIFKECNKWYQKVSVIIKRYEHERKEVTINGWT